jgi:hypothetical protein
VDTLDKLAAALGFSRLDLLKASGVIEQPNNHRESEEERRMLAVFRDLSDEGRLTVMQFARFVHTDEHHWVQSNLLDGHSDEHHPGQLAATASKLNRSLFELADDQPSRAAPVDSD